MCSARFDLQYGVHNTVLVQCTDLSSLFVQFEDC